MTFKDKDIPLFAVSAGENLLMQALFALVRIALGRGGCPSHFKPSRESKPRSEDKNVGGKGGDGAGCVPGFTPQGSAFFVVQEARSGQVY